MILLMTQSEFTCLCIILGAAVFAAISWLVIAIRAFRDAGKPYNQHLYHSKYSYNSKRELYYCKKHDYSFRPEDYCDECLTERKNEG